MDEELGLPRDGGRLPERSRQHERAAARLRAGGARTGDGVKVPTVHQRSRMGEKRHAGKPVGTLATTSRFRFANRAGSCPRVGGIHEKVLLAHWAALLLASR